MRINSFALKFSEMTLLEAIWVKEAEVEWPHSRLGAHAALAIELRNFTKTLVDRQHEWSRFSRHALWAMAASSWGAQFAAIGGRLGRSDEALAEARAVLAIDPEIAARCARSLRSLRRRTPRDLPEACLLLPLLQGAGAAFLRELSDHSR